MLKDSDSRSIKEVFVSITENISTLIRSELELFKVEMAEEAKKFSQIAAMGAVAVMLGLLGMVFLLVTVVLILSMVLPTWAATGLIMVILLGSAAVVGANIKSKIKSLSVKPEETIETLKEDVQWSENLIKSAAKSKPLASK